MATLGLDTSEYEQGIEQARKETQSAANSLNRSANTAGNGVAGMASQFAAASAKANILAGMLTSLGTKAAGLAKNLVETGFSYNAQIETYRTGLTNMLGSAEAANQALEKMKQDAARTPFDTESIVKANQYLLGAGENAAYARKTILALGDAVSATGGGSDELNRMAQNLQQIANVGKASSVDIKQFAFAGINIYQVLADYTGKSVKDVQSMTITYDVLTKALQAAAEEGGRYYNSMNTQSQTLTGRLSTLKDNATQLAGALTEDLSDAYGKLITKANELAVAMKDGWETDGFDGMMESAAEAVPQLEGVANAAVWLKENGSKLVPILTTLTGSFVAMKVAAGAGGLLTAITSLLNPMGLLAGAFVTAYTTSEDFRDIVNGAVGDVWSFCAPIFNKLLDGLAKVQNGFNHAASAAKRFWNAQGGSTTDEDGFGGSDGGTIPGGRFSAGHGAGRSDVKEPEDVAPETVDSDIPSGSGGDGSKNKNKNKNKTVKKTVLSALTDAATSYSSNEYGQITTSVTELTEHIKDSTGKVYDQLTRTTTESGKELVNGVVKNYKLVTKEVTDKNGKVTTTTQKTYEDASKSLVSTLTQTAQTLKNGISTTIESVTKKYQDNSEHIEQTATETGTRIVNGALETYTKVKTLMDGVETDSKETSQAVVSQYDTLTSNYGAAAERVAQLQAAYNESAASTGEFSEQTLKIGYLLTEEEEKLDAASKALKEYQKNNNRANAQVNKFKNLISESNAAFSDFGSSLTSLGEFFDSEVLQNAGDFFTIITNGVSQALNFAASVETLVTTLQTLKTAIEAVNATGGISSVVSGIGKLIGAGGATVAAGTAGAATAGAATAGAAGTAGAATAGTGVAALGLSIPQIGLIVAGVLAVGAVGYGIYKWATKDKDQTEKKASSSSKLSYKDIQDAYWYGNERAFAGYDYRTDPYTFRQQPSMSDYQNKMQAELARIGEFVEKYLPETGKGVVALDGEEVARIITPSVNANLGQLAVLSGRGN
jgi:tape measure domain-containing protein